MAGEWILLVEDNDVLREGLKSILEQEGYQAIYVATGAHKSKRLDLPGEDVDGIIPGIH